MNPRTVWNVAADVLREAVFSKYLIVLFGLIFLGLVTLALALDLEVVDGMISAGKLFGGTIIGGQSMAVGELLTSIMPVIVYLVCFLGTIFMIIAVADIAPRVLQPGRVELTLSLPIRRHELVAGIYLGVLIIAASSTLFGIGGASMVLFVKLKMASAAPLVGALCALVGFLAIYGVMLATSCVARSPALSAGFGFLVFGAGLATSDRRLVLMLIKSGVTRDLAALVMGPLPRLKTLADIGGEYAGGQAIRWGEAVPVIGGSVAFGLFFVALACIVVTVKDY
ncbi:MAG: hypothetical protein HYS27_03525 [Deltaproteobacteria bacterium]|nr:hypothetical protein [Deltaproteobacteria bacterium]